VASEYTPLANLLFAAARVAADKYPMFPTELDSYSWAWMSIAWVAYVGFLSVVVADRRWGSLVLFVHPMSLLFVLVRFEIFPVALTYLALRAARDDRHLGAAFWLGLGVAMKGYPLFVAPALVVFVWRRAGWRRAAMAAVLCVLPMLVATAAVYSYAGLDGVAAPYKFHAKRGLDSNSSTYEAAVEAFGWDWPKRIVEWKKAPLIASGVASLLAAGLVAVRRRGEPFAGLVAAGLVSLTVLMSLSLFYSPQFVMWLLPFVAWSGSRVARILAHVYLLMTAVHFPYAFVLRLVTNYSKWSTDLFTTAIVGMSLCRFALGTLALVWLCFPRRPPTEPPATPEAVHGSSVRTAKL
jgi:uncharacterized membrane protein